MMHDSSRTIHRTALVRLLSPHVGPIRALRELSTPPDHAPLPAFVAETADMREIHRCRVRKVPGSALHYDRGAAIAAALGEAVERYCGAALPGDLPMSSAADLGASAVAPDRFVLFRADQYGSAGFPYRPFEETTTVRWTKGVDVSNGAPVDLPAQLVYLGGEGWGAAGETPIGYATSNGMACATGADDAILAGLLEVIERDAVMLTWYLRRAPRRLQWRADPRLAAVEERYFVPTGLRYDCFDLSDFLGVPTVLALVFGIDVGLAVGAASALTPQDAWLKAMREAYATYAWADRLWRTSPPISQTRLDLVQGFVDHVRFYADRKNQSLASFLWRSPEERHIGELPQIMEPSRIQQIAEICRRLRAAGASVYAVDLTTADVRRVGLDVWKVVSPELQPLDVGYDRRFLGGTRISRTAARFMGHAVESIADLNPWPHPFP